MNLKEQQQNVLLALQILWISFIYLRLQVRGETHTSMDYLVICFRANVKQIAGTLTVWSTTQMRDSPTLFQRGNVTSRLKDSPGLGWYSEVVGLITESAEVEKVPL